MGTLFEVPITFLQGPISLFYLSGSGNLDIDGPIDRILGRFCNDHQRVTVGTLCNLCTLDYRGDDNNVNPNVHSLSAFCDICSHNRLIRCDGCCVRRQSNLLGLRRKFLPRLHDPGIFGSLDLPMSSGNISPLLRSSIPGATRLHTYGT